MTDSPSSSLELSSSQLLLHGAEMQSPADAQPTHENGAEIETRRLSGWDAFVLLVLTQIGAGLFASPAQVDSNVPSPGVALFAWLFACLLGWTGAASFADLASLFPAGGMEEYLARFWGETTSFLMAWTWITVVKPSSMAMVSTVLTEYLLAGLGIDSPSWLVKFLTVVCFIAIVLPNLHSTRTSATISNIFFAIKLITVSLVILAGFYGSTLGTNPWTRPWFTTRPSIVGDERIDWSGVSWWDLMGHFCTAAYAVLWACTGWDNVRHLLRATLQIIF
jgi:L-type amino acid transporter 9